MLAADTRTGAKIGAYAKSSPIAWAQIVEGLTPFLKDVSSQLAAQVNQFEPEIAEYARYALAVQGKQFRPMLVALSAEAAGTLNEQHVTAAAIVEMVHLATLVHDDVIDEAELRRGQPTLAANWGNEISVLLGDCLFAQALRLAASFPTPEICRAVAASTSTVCSGEILQTQRRSDFAISQADYFKIVSMKTGELFALSCYLGGFLAQASTAEREGLRQYGMALGTAYQIYDDCIDLFGSEESAGKTLGADLANGEVTLPLLIALQRASESVRNELRDLLRHWNPASLPHVVDLLDESDALNETRNTIGQYLAAARQDLLVLPATPGRAALANMTEFLAQQTEALEPTA